MLDRNSPVPLYLQIREQILELIEQEDFDSEQSLPPETKLAADYEVSVMTVRQAYAQLVKEGVLYRIPGKGTFLKSNERELSHNLAILTYAIERINHPFTAGVITSIRQALEKAKLKHGIFLDTFKEDLFYKNLVKPDKVDGLFIIGQEMTEEDVARWGSYALPMVLLYYPYPIEGASVIALDGENSIKQAVNYLVKLGHTKIGFVGGFLEYPLDQQKLAGFRLALKNNHLTLREDWIIDGRYDSEIVSKALEPILSGPERPTAIIAADDLMAMDCIYTAERLNISVPDNLSVIGFGEIGAPVGISYGLTTLRIPWEKMGERSVQMMRELLHGAAEPHFEAYQAELVVRNSCAQLKSSTKVG